jgi:hypothetical protein
MKSEKEKFDKPWLLLCEGVGDERFFNRILKQEGLQDVFSVHRPSWESGGRSQFGKFLRDNSTNEDFISNVRAILIVSDNDIQPDKSFKEVQEELAKAKDFPIPDEEGKPARKAGNVTVVILMIPVGKLGNLESICLESAYKKWDFKEHLDVFVTKTPAKDWDVGKQAKMRIHTILASTNYKDPDFGFARHWTADEKSVIPTDHDCFKEIVDFIKGFGELVGA